MGEIGHAFIIFLINLLIFLLALLIILSFKGNKPYKVKEDILFIEKQLLKTSILFLYLILFIYELLTEDEFMYNVFKTKIICFNIYIMLYFMNNLFKCLEDYYTYNNPIYYFNSLFHKTKFNFKYEIISLFVSTIYSFSFFNDNFQTIIMLLNGNDNDNDRYKEINFKSPFIVLNIGGIIIMFLMNISILIMYIILKLKIKKIIFKAREKLLRIFNRQIIITFLYVIFISLNCFVFSLEKNRDKEKDIQLFLNLNSYLFLVIFLIDTLFELITYSTSKFAQYKLKNKMVNSIGSIFNRDKEVDHPSNSFLDSMLENTSYNRSRVHNDDEEEDDENTLLMPLNSNDIELVLIYRNNIFIEDYFFYYYDYIMNITLSALFKVYTSKKFSPTAMHNNKLKKEMSITESRILGPGDKNNDTYTSNNLTLKKTLTNEEDISIIDSETNKEEFEFVRDSMRNDFCFSEEIFTNTLNDFSYDNIKVTITSYFTAKCISNLFDKNITSKVMGESLTSHINNDVNESENIKLDKRDISTQNLEIPYHSILSCNAKEEYFLNLKNMMIRTYDKQLTFDIFETNDDEINLNENNSNKKIASMLDEYFSYVKGRGVSGTFLPIILGVFKVKINSFKTLLIYISFNSLIENSPSNSFSYWQLIRFSHDTTKKVASSKYRHNVLIGDDLIFDRKYALPSIKEDNDSSYNKIEIKNYLNFQDMIDHDIEFLSKSRCNYTNLLMMYFEYENTQKHEKEGAIKIRKINDKVEIINTAAPMPIFKEDEEESDENIYIEDFSKKQDSENATIPISSEENTEKKNNTTSNKISVLNSVNVGSNSNTSNNHKDKDDINENLDIEISKSVRNKDDELKKTMTDKTAIQSLFGSLNSVNSIIDDTLMSFEDTTMSITKNKKLMKSHNMLNYKEQIKINSYEGYFDDFNCLCLFSFENIFQLKSDYNCSSNNYNQLQKSIMSNFNDYTPRKHTILNKKTDKKNK